MDRSTSGRALHEATTLNQVRFIATLSEVGGRVGNKNSWHNMITGDFRMQVLARTELLCGTLVDLHIQIAEKSVGDMCN